MGETPPVGGSGGEERKKQPGRSGLGRKKFPSSPVYIFPFSLSSFFTTVKVGTGNASLPQIVLFFFFFPTFVYDTQFFYSF
jgi:hypothetical protein